MAAHTRTTHARFAPARWLLPALATAAFAAALAPGAATASTFALGELQDRTVGAAGCGTNVAAEPAIEVSPDDNVFLSSERGLGAGTDVWRQLGGLGGVGASACALEFRGVPNGIGPLKPAGGDTDLAIGSQATAGVYPVYVASLDLASVAVSTSTDNGDHFRTTPVVAGIPDDDREWIAAYGDRTSLLTYHDSQTSNIDVLRSDDTGRVYAQISQAIPATNYKASNNEIGNIAIDRRNTAGTKPGRLGAVGFWAYQSFVAPSRRPLIPPLARYNEAFIAVSNDGGYHWKDQPIPCSVSAGRSLDHQFPNVSVAPNGDVWAAWSDDRDVFTAVSSDHGASWTCSPRVSPTTAQAVFTWLVATSAGVDLVYYGSPTTTNQTWYVEFAQNLSSTPGGWGAPEQLVAVHQGPVCESGAGCLSGRQLFDDFGVDADRLGWAHIAYSQDSPSLGGTGSSTGYAVQTGGAQVGAPN
jgi:hypothetical protein